jgi:adenylosuccinate synthase
VAAQKYVRYLEDAVGCKIRYVSVGADRDQYIDMN